MPKRHQITKAQFVECLQLLGITQEQFNAPLTAEHPQAALDDLKWIIKRAWRKLVSTSKVHPDQGGDLERWKVLQNVMDLVEDMKMVDYVPPHVQPVVRSGHIVFQGQTVFTTSTTSTTSTTFGGGWIPGTGIRITVVKR